VTGVEIGGRHYRGMRSDVIDLAGLQMSPIAHAIVEEGDATLEGDARYCASPSDTKSAAAAIGRKCLSCVGQNFIDV
jgi:hypothetical protein